MSIEYYECLGSDPIKRGEDHKIRSAPSGRDTYSLLSNQAPFKYGLVFNQSMLRFVPRVASHNKEASYWNRFYIQNKWWSVP